ncbi:glycoside hydrolase family 28 protein [Lutibacter sp. B1]|uniref:glycoside hydrolase family 28 protein n=1 Tax=Lutibacter sp. B1 TaxID=2725996 RepID=UPI0014571CC1|nr:glycoside hydrolase family 28 protein [Lutibacter sp. B1]NLP58697.1 glycoside hydrolase family 28 protein [Lutibacter sp. B1]
MHFIKTGFKKKRKPFKKGFFLLFIVLLIFVSCKNKKDSISSITNSSWEIMYQVIDSVGTITFPDKTFNVLDFGAKSDEIFDNTQAFKKAIEKCANDGGGSVIVPEGKYLTGPIHLESNVNLHLDEGAEILFSTNPNDYYPLVHTSFEGTELMNYSPLIYAYKKKNIAVTGKGILNGQANNENWWPWCGKDTYGWKEGMPNQQDSLNRPQLVKLAEMNVPPKERVFGDGHYLRPSFFEPFECSNVMIEGVKIVNAPFWVIHPIKSVNVIVNGVTVESHGPNNDGCDPEYSKNVIIRNCTFNTGDDCIAIKSGRNEDGRRVAIKSENIIVQNCKMIDGHGGVVMGSEISAGVKNVFVENCSMDSPNLDRAIRIKTNSKRGGVVEGVYVRNIEVGQVKEAVLKINMFYDVHGNQTGNFIPIVRNVNLENIKVKNGGKFGILAKGYAESPIQNIHLNNVTIDSVKTPFSLENVKDLHLENTYINGELMKSIIN